MKDLPHSLSLPFTTTTSLGALHVGDSLDALRELPDVSVDLVVGRFNHFLKDAVEYCFQFAKTDRWQFFPEQCLTPARWDRKDVERRKKLPHNYQRANAPSGQGRKRVQAGPDLVRPSTLLAFEPEFQPNPTRHPARFPVALPDFFVRLLTKSGDLVVDPFAGTCTTAVAAERLERRWLMAELDAGYTTVLEERLAKGR
jgi:DNA modification methylase